MRDHLAGQPAGGVARRHRPAPPRPSALGVAGLPMGLILLQPDLGTMLVFVAITMAMLLHRRRAGPPHPASLTVVGVVLRRTGRCSSNVLKEYQKDRLTVFIDPDNADDERVRTTSTSRRSPSSNGGLTGGGLFEGTQTQLRLRARAADRLHLHRGGRGARLRRRRHASSACSAVIVWRIWRTARARPRRVRPARSASACWPCWCSSSSRASA